MCGDAINGRLSEARLTGHRDTADGDGAGLWDLIEFLCGLATGHWHWPQLGPADGWAEIRRDNGGEERRGLSWSTLNHSDIQYPALGHNNYRMKEGRRLRDPQQCQAPRHPCTQAPRHPGRLVIAITYLLLPTNAMK